MHGMETGKDDVGETQPTPGAAWRDEELSVSAGTALKAGRVFRNGRNMNALGLGDCEFGFGENLFGLI